MRTIKLKTRDHGTLVVPAGAVHLVHDSPALNFGQCDPKDNGKYTTLEEFPPLTLAHCGGHFYVLETSLEEAQRRIDVGLAETYVSEEDACLDINPKHKRYRR